MTTKSITPSIRATAFNCPHCGVLCTQYWYNLHREFIGDNPRTPSFPGEGIAEAIAADPSTDAAKKRSLLVWVDKMQTGEPFAYRQWKQLEFQIGNLYVSECYDCRKISVWVAETLVYPANRIGPAPNPDLPCEVVRDFEEARSVLTLSPRGAAALLRLCVQKVCIALGEKGKSIDEDIASLVAKGLNPLVQQALDVVRVIGNEAVHPGVLDIKDDSDTASQLFLLVNAIADQMISHPKRVSELYEKLPPEKRQAIENRNAKATKGGITS